MANRNVFIVDGVTYNVHVTDLVRKFSVLDTDKSGRTMDGEMYRDPIGTYYNYTMTISPKDDDIAAMDAFWDTISKPQKCFNCTFPYNQTTLSQKMYVTSGEQSVKRITGERVHWGEITINFIAMSPKVTP